jgi:hypothetical protein
MKAASFRRTKLGVAVLLLLASPVLTPAQQNQLHDYAGTYPDAPGHTLEIIAGDDLFAV